MYLDKRTVITLIIILTVVIGGIAFVAFNPTARKANENILKQSEAPLAPNPNAVR